MSQPAQNNGFGASSSGSFPTTHWSAILAAGGDGRTADSALAELCGTYWYPLYVFARRKGHEPADAQDLTQGFFTHLLEAQLLQRADPRKGRFRSFLLGCFNVYIASEARRMSAAKRAGWAITVPIHLERAEQCLAAELSSSPSPELLFDRHWAVAVLESAMTFLEAESDKAGRGRLLKELMPALAGEDDRESYEEIARRMGTTPGTIKVTAHRLRRRYRELVRLVVSRTVNDPLDVDAELGHLMAALRQ